MDDLTYSCNESELAEQANERLTRLLDTIRQRERGRWQGEVDAQKELLLWANDLFGQLIAGVGARHAIPSDNGAYTFVCSYCRNYESHADDCPIKQAERFRALIAQVYHTPSGPE